MTQCFKRRLFVLLPALLLAAAGRGAYDPATDRLLQGTMLFSGNATNAALAFDGNASTYYSTSVNSDFQWVGLDLNEPYVVTRIEYTPAPGTQGAWRMQLGIFEGANSPDFMDAVPLYLISQAPARGQSTAVDINVSRGFRYVRYVGSTGSYCNIAELKFYGHAGEGDDSQFYQITNLPTLSVHVEDNILPTVKGQDFESLSTLVYEGGTMIQEYPILFRVRGNFSSTHENKAFRIKYNDGKSHHMMRGAANEAPAKAKKWVLINSYRDKTLMRNPVAWAMSKRGERDWTPWSQIVDLVVNGTYWGTYTLADAVTVDKNRINITEMTELDTEDEYLTGGYFVEVDNNASSEPYWFDSNRKNPISVHEPDEDIIQPVQFNYIENTWNQMEDIVFGANYTDPEAGLRSVLDMETFLRWFLISEFNGNTDMICQVFYYKERGDDHFYTGPIWDADLALENDETTYPANERMDWTYKVRCTGNWDQFVSRVLSDPSVFAQLQGLWAELRKKGNFEPEDVAADVDSLRREVRASAQLNFIRWPYLNQWLQLTPAVPGSWEAEVDRVRDFVRDRVDWMDQMLSYGTLRQVDGIYQIASGLDLCTFSQMVNEKGMKDAQAVLVNDIDMTAFSSIFQPIGLRTAMYAGSFDGQGHTISGLHLTGEDAVGLFAYLGNCKLSNIVFDATCRVEGANNVGMLAGHARSGAVSITGIENHGSVVASASGAAALIGLAELNAPVTATNCSNTGNITAASNAAALIGPSKGKVTATNCYNTGTVAGAVEGKEFAFANKSTVIENCWDYTSSQTLNMTAAMVDGGVLCYQLNGGENAAGHTWRQNLDNGRRHDPWPVLNKKSGVVFLRDGRYTNTTTDQTSFRYYNLVVTAVQGPEAILQFSEFALFDQDFIEMQNLLVYGGSAGFNNRENWPSLTDKNLETKFCGSFSGYSYFLFDAGTEVDPFGYRIYTAGDTDRYPARNPISWRLYGSNVWLDDPGDSEWILIDEQTDNHSLPAANYTPADFYLVHALQTLSIDRHSATLLPGEELQLAATYAPQNIGNVTLQWTSTDEQVASVDGQGHVVAHGLGEADIIVSAPDVSVLHDTCHISVVSERLVFYRYYKLQVSATQGAGGVIQFSEFDLLDEQLSEVQALAAYAGTQGNNMENWPNLTDNDVLTKYCGGFGGNSYFLFDAQHDVCPYGYRIYTAGDTQKYPERNLGSWQLYGSSEMLTDPYDERWVLLDTRTDDHAMPAANCAPTDFYIRQVPNLLMLDRDSALFEPGDTLQLHVSDRTGDIAQMHLTWTSTDERVATISSGGLVTAVAPGRTDVVVVAQEDETLRDTCSVTVARRLPGHRYYQFAFEAIHSGNIIQLAEFDLLDRFGNPVAPLSLYHCTGTYIKDHDQADLFDDDLDTKYCGNFYPGDTLYIYIDAGRRVMLSGYRMTTAADAQRYPGRNPLSWSLWGSDSPATDPDDSSWTLLDRHQNNDVIGAYLYMPFDFYFDYPHVFCPGDVNGDGHVNSDDYDDLRAHILGIFVWGFVPEAADFNDDGKVNAQDLVRLTYLIQTQQE